MTIHEIRVHLHEKIAALKRIDHLIKPDAFGEVFNSVSDEQKCKIRRIIALGDDEELRGWFRENIKGSRSIGEKTVAELRKIGQRLGVKQYYLLQKAELLAEIQRCQTR